jgi:hypothetical protein
MNVTDKTHRWRSAALLLAAAALAAGELVAPAVASADTGGTNTVKVLNAPTITPPATGGTFSVSIVANGSTAISGAGAGLAFDKAKLQVTAIAKDATEAANGVTYLGFPSSGNLAMYVANANASGQIPNVSWTYLDGSSSETANADHGIYSVTFQVIALGDSTLSLNDSPAILDGSVATYGTALAPLTTVNGIVHNSAAGPTASITPLAAWLGTNAVPVKWSGTGSGPLTYDLQYRKAPPSTAVFGALTPWQTGVSTTTATFTTAPGYTYCFSSRTHDGSGTSAWTAETCTAAPLDDRALTRAGSWSAKTGSAFYRGTYLQTTSLGAKLTKTGVKVKRVALVASTCSTCGSVSVYLGSKLLKSISLKSTTTANKKLITVYTFSAATSGTLTIKVTSSGKKVIIDGVVLSAR